LLIQARDQRRLPHHASFAECDGQISLRCDEVLYKTYDLLRIMHQPFTMRKLVGAVTCAARACRQFVIDANRRFGIANKIRRPGRPTLRRGGCAVACDWACRRRSPGCNAPPKIQAQNIWPHE